MAAKSSMMRVNSIYRKGLFKGKCAIVTGGGTGIGKAISQELLYLGCKVMIASRKLDRLKETAEELRKQSSLKYAAQLEFTECNIRHEDQVRKLMQTTVEKFGKIDFLINNGGGQFLSPAESITLKGWNAVLETNLTGTFLCCREAYDTWMRDNGGVIVNIIADMFKGMPGMCHSGAARAGVDNLTKTLAVEWAHAGVRINAVVPICYNECLDPGIGLRAVVITTEAYKPGSSIKSSTAAANYVSSGIPNVFERQIPFIPAKRLGTPEEISAAVCYLLSPAAAFVSGETIKVDGAHTLVAASIPWEVPDHNKSTAYSWETDIGDVTDDDDIPPSKL